MAEKKSNAAQAKKIPSPRKPKSASAGRKKPVPAGSGKGRATAAAKPAAKKQASRVAPKPSAAKPGAPRAKATPASAAREEENRVVHAAKKAIDDIVANRKVTRTKKATKELAHQLLERAEHMVKDAATASSDTVDKARKATRRTAYNFVKSAIKFLESVEEKIEAKPVRKKTAGGKSVAKPAAAKKPTKKHAKKNSSPSAAGGKS